MRTQTPVRRIRAQQSATPAGGLELRFGSVFLAGMEGAGGGVFDCLVSVFADGMVEVEGGAFGADARNRKEVVARVRA
jgi:hypothetical protein